MIGVEAIGNDPGHLCKYAVGDVREDSRLRDDNIAVPVGAGAGASAVNGLLLTDVLDGNRSSPDGTGGRRVVAPSHPVGLKEITQCGMFEAWILRWLGGFASSGIYHRDRSRQWSNASGWLGRIPRGKEWAGRSGGRSTGNDELVRRKAWTFVGLEHAVAECVLLGQGEVRRNIGWQDVLVLRIGMQAWRTQRCR